MGNLFQLRLAQLHFLQRPLSADDGKTHILLIMKDPDDLDQADLSGAGNMGRAARTDVDAGDRHEPDALRKADLAAVFQLFQFLRGRIGCRNGKILPDDPVGSKLQVPDLFIIQLTGGVQRYGVLAQAEAHVLITVYRVQDAGQDMLAGMVLHIGKTVLPVDLPADGLSLRKKGGVAAGNGMRNNAVLYLDIGHGKTFKNARVRRLSAFLREKQRPVQNDKEPFCSGKRHSLYYRGSEFHCVSVFVIKLDGVHDPPEK